MRAATEPRLRTRSARLTVGIVMREVIGTRHLRCRQRFIARLAGGRGQPRQRHPPLAIVLTAACLGYREVGLAARAGAVVSAGRGSRTRPRSCLISLAVGVGNGVGR